MSDTTQALQQLTNVALQAYQAAGMSDMGAKSRKLYEETRNLQLADVKEARKQNIEQAALNRKFIEDYYNKYQSPEAMARQYNEAGFNPYAAVGATSSFDSSSMGNIPSVNPSDTLAPLSEYARNTGSSLMAQQAGVNQALSSAFQNAVNMTMQFEQLDNLREETRAKRISNDNDEFFQRMMQTPVGDKLFQLLPGLEEILGEFQTDAPNFTSNSTRGATLGQVFHLANLIAGLKSENETGAGFYSNSPQTPFNKYLRDVSDFAHKHNISWRDFDAKKMDSPFMSPWLSAFDVVHGSNLAGISQNKYQQWYNDWSLDLRKKGINPEGNDLFTTALRLIHANGYKKDSDFMFEQLGKSLGNAALHLGDIFDFLNGLDQFVPRKSRK